MAGTVTQTIASGRSRGIVRLDCAITLDGSGVASVTAVGAVHGRIVAVGFSTGITSTADVFITCDGAEVISDLTWGASASWYRPTNVARDNTSVAITAATTASDLNRDLVVAGTLSLRIANGGAAQTGTLSIVVDEEFHGGLSNL